MPSLFGILTAGTVAVLAMIPPLVLLAPYRAEQALVVLGFSAMFGLLAGTLAFLYATPLVAVGSSTARYDRLGYVALVIGLILVALANEYFVR